jgi:hypothetical protein
MVLFPAPPSSNRTFGFAEYGFPFIFLLSLLAYDIVDTNGRELRQNPLHQLSGEETVSVDAVGELQLPAD